MKKKVEQEIWKKLLSCKRIKELELSSIEGICVKEPRNPYERDCDRITYSYPFRRLQDKTQVVPLPTTDFVHTRLTHTLEVATVGRSLGRMAEYYLLDRRAIGKDKCGDIPAIVTAACLAHDIGNPPFGHSGEKSISEYFKFNYGATLLIDCYFTRVSESQEEEFIPNDASSMFKWHDLKNFEGNAMGFRILNRTGGSGLDLTLATLGTFIKYPRMSWIDNKIFSSLNFQSRQSQKKYGIFYSEKKIFHSLFDELEIKCLYNEDGCLSYARHPLAFLMEAADDICYRIIDLEDGVRIGRIEFKDAEKLLLEIAAYDKRFDRKYYRRISGVGNKIGYLRSKCINILVHQCFGVWKDNYEDIIMYEFDRELLQSIESDSILKAVSGIRKLINKNVYNWSDVLLLEATGFKVLSGLVEAFVNAADLCISCDEDAVSESALKLHSLLPDEFKKSDDSEDPYLRYQKICDYVSGMTDTFALNLFRKINGISI